MKYILISLVSLSLSVYADDNHVHVDQVNGGDNFDFTVDQYGYNNLIRFSFDHQNNTVNLDQIGNNLYIGYTDDWGSGYNWGGDLDGLRNDVDIRQKCSKVTCNDNDFQFHILGDDNVVKFGQGYSLNDSTNPTWNYDNNEPGGNFVRLDIHGDYNRYGLDRQYDDRSD